MAEKQAELGNVATGRGVGGDDLEQAASGQVAHLVVQHHHRLGAVEAAGIEYRGPDLGVKNSIYMRDPDGIQIEILSHPLLDTDFV